MAIDYGGMSALTEIFKGSSAARKNRRAETAAMQQEMLQQEDRDLKNSQLIATESAAIEKARGSYLKLINKQPHMVDYTNNFFNEKQEDLKGVLKSYNGSYTKAMTSGKVLDMRNSMLSAFKESDKFQSAERSASQLALFDAYTNKAETQNLISKKDLDRRAQFLRDGNGEFQMGALRSEYDIQSADEIYEGNKQDFEVIFNEQYDKVLHNYRVETGDDQDLTYLRSYADTNFNGDTQAALMDWAKGDMGKKGAYNPKLEGTKEMPIFEQETLIRSNMNRSVKGGLEAEVMMNQIISAPAIRQMGVSDIGITQKGSVQLYSKKVFTHAMPQALNVIKNQSIPNGIKDNGDGSFDFENINGMYDADGSFVDGVEAMDNHSNMKFSGMHLASKAIIQIDNGDGTFTEKSQLIGNSRDKDIRASIKKQYGENFSEMRIVPTFVGTFEHNNSLGGGFDSMRWWDKQLHVEVDPNGMNLEKMISDTGQEDNMKKSRASDVDYMDVSGNTEKTVLNNVEKINAQITAKANNRYAAQTTPEGKPVTMSVIDTYISGWSNVNASEQTKKNQNLFTGIASMVAENAEGDYLTNTRNAYTAFDGLMKGTNDTSKRFQKVVESGDRNSIFATINNLFGLDIPESQAEELAVTWSNFKK
tara:strand:+ start:831 stop:2771 length:1941 start_codon:yes stop_codon:yes gene_type:complete